MVTSVSDRPCPCNIALLIFPPHLSPSPAERIRAREGLHKWEWKQSQEQGREVRVQLWTRSTAQKKRGGRICADCPRENREAEEDRIDLKRDPACTSLRCKKKDRPQQIVPFQRIPQLQQHKVKGIMKQPEKNNSCRGYLASTSPRDFLKKRYNSPHLSKANSRVYSKVLFINYHCGCGKLEL